MTDTRTDRQTLPNQPTKLPPATENCDEGNRMKQRWQGRLGLVFWSCQHRAVFCLGWHFCKVGSDLVMGFDIIMRKAAS
jgi:hypothetical protein